MLARTAAISLPAKRLFWEAGIRYHMFNVLSRRGDVPDRQCDEAASQYDYYQGQCRQQDFRHYIPSVYYGYRQRCLVWWI
jgi:hypothetical protein